MVEGDCSEKTYYMGPGAGSGPTASAVAADIIDIAQGRRSTVFGINANNLKLSVNKKKTFLQVFILGFY